MLTEDSESASFLSFPLRADKPAPDKIVRSSNRRTPAHLLIDGDFAPGATRCLRDRFSIRQLPGKRLLAEQMLPRSERLFGDGALMPGRHSNVANNRFRVGKRVIERLVDSRDVVARSGCPRRLAVNVVTAALSRIVYFIYRQMRILRNPATPDQRSAIIDASGRTRSILQIENWNRLHCLSFCSQAGQGECTPGCAGTRRRCMHFIIFGSNCQESVYDPPSTTMLTRRMARTGAPGWIGR